MTLRNALLAALLATALLGPARPASAQCGTSWSGTEHFDLNIAQNYFALGLSSIELVIQNPSTTTQAAYQVTTRKLYLANTGFSCAAGADPYVNRYNLTQWSSQSCPTDYVPANGFDLVEINPGADQATFNISVAFSAYENRSAKRPSVQAQLIDGNGNLIDLVQLSRRSCN